MDAQFVQMIAAASLVLAVFLTIIACVVFIFFYLKAKHTKSSFKDLHQELRVGQKVVTMGGIYGTITAVRRDTCDLKVASGAVLEVSRFAIEQIQA